MPTKSNDSAHTLTEQLACARRELSLRRKVYPQWVRAKRMNPFKAEEEIALMVSIVKTLDELVAQKEQPRLV